MRRLWMWPVLVSLVVAACIKNDNTNINNNGPNGPTGPSGVVVTSVSITSFPTGPLQLVCPAGSTSGQVTFAFAARVEPADASQQVVWSASGGQMSASGVLTATQAGTYTVRATSVADPTKYSEVSVVVVGCTPQTGETPVLTFTATPSSITAGQSSTLSWGCSNGVTLVKSGGWSGSAAISGSQVVSPATTTTYTLTCSNPYGSVTQSVTVAVATAGAQKPNITASRDLIWGTACPASGPSRSFVHSDIAISQWRTLDGQLVTLADQESDDVTAVANSTNASGTARIVGTTAQGMADTVQVAVNACPQTGPTGQVTGIEVVPPSQDCVVGSHANFSAVVRYTGAISSTAVKWTVPSSGVASVVTQAPNDIVLRCNSPGTLTVSASPVADMSFSDTGVLTVVNPPAPTCPSTIDYAPAGGSLAANQNRELAVQNWPSGATDCQPFWYLDKPHIAQINGADNIITIDGKQYYAGIHAVLRGVSPGNVIVCVQTSIQTPEVKRCYTWVITAPISADRIPLAGGSGNKLKYMNVEGVSQTFEGF